MIITIDGPSGTGKSTVAKGLAKRLGFSFFDTGAMYRSVAWHLLQNQVDVQDESQLCNALDTFLFHITTDKGEKKYFVGEKEVTKEIRAPNISEYSSKVAAIASIRKKIVDIQREFAENRDSVFEGRDMGSVVFPKADLKIYLNAKPEIRAQRRYIDLLNKFPEKKENLDKEKISEDIEKRDKFDSTREISPLVKQEDMVEIDTSNQSADEVIEEILKHLSKLTWKMKPFYHFIISIVRPFFKIFYRLKVYGTEHFPKGAAIVAPNHVSFFDPPVVGVTSPDEVHFMAKGSLFRFPIFGWLIRKLNSHPISKGAKDAVVVKEIYKLLMEGKKVLLFPEGSRSFDGKLALLQPGVAFLAYKAKCSIIPVYLDGTFDVWSRKRKFPKLFGKITCVYGHPIRIDPKLDRKVYMDEVLKKTEKAIEDLRKWFEEGAKGPFPSVEKF